MIKISNKLLLPLVIVAVVGACAPYPEAPRKEIEGIEGIEGIASETESRVEGITDTRQQEIVNASNPTATNETKTNTTVKKETYPTRPAIAPVAKPNYPTATRVPGKEGFVFNPYTHNTVDVKGIASGKLVRDPEDADTSHKFRVP